MRQVQTNMRTAILQYSDTEYAVRYEQYSTLLEMGEYGTNAVHMCDESQLGGLIGQNLTYIYEALIHNHTAQHLPLDMLNEESLVEALERAMEELSHYFASWHKTTTFHLQRRTPHGEAFIKQRTNVFTQSLAQLGEIVRRSRKV